MGAYKRTHFGPLLFKGTLNNFYRNANFHDALCCVCNLPWDLSIILLSSYVGFCCSVVRLGQVQYHDIHVIEEAVEGFLQPIVKHDNVVQPLPPPSRSEGG